MKTLTLALLVLLLVALPVAAATAAGQTKVEVCHITSEYDFGNGSVPVGHVIDIADPAYQSHLDHGDPDSFILASLADGTTVCKQPQWTLIETLSVPSNGSVVGPAGATSTNVLKAGTQYQFKASGTWTQYGYTMDAEYSRSSGGDIYDGVYPIANCPSCGADWADLQINGGFVNWGAFNAAREYWYEMAGTGSTVNFRIYEGLTGTNTVIPSWYPDNTGNLSVEIYEQQ